MLTRNDNGDELNFNLQTLSTSTTTAAPANTTTSSTTTSIMAVTSDYVLPSTVSADAISKFAAISPVEVTPSITSVVAVKPFATSGYIPMDGTTTTSNSSSATVNNIAPATNINTVAPISYVAPVTRHRASVSGALPTLITHNLQTISDNDFNSSTKTPATAIISNSQLPRAEQWLGQIVKNASPASRRANLHTRAKSLTTDDPFNAEWVASVTSKIDEVTKLPASEQPIIKHTNPFRSPIKQVEL